MSAAVLERALFGLLQKGDDETYELSERGALSLRGKLIAALDRPDAWDELRRLLQLAVALERELSSPAAAARIRAVLRSEPEAVAMIRTRLIKIGAIDQLRSFQAREDREASRTAPITDLPLPPRTLRLDELRPDARGRLR